LPSLRIGRDLLPWLALLTVWVVWGSTYLAIRAAVETIPPLIMAGFRYLVAGALLFAIAGPGHARGEQRPAWAHLRSALVIGALLLVGGNGLLSVGERHLTSGLAALIVATVPVWMVAINAAVTRARVTRAMLLALGLGTAGVAVLIGGPGGASAATGSAVVVLVASVLWAAGSVYARMAPLPRDPLVTTSLEMIAGGLLLLIAGWASGELSGFDLRAVSAGSLIGLIWLIVPGSMVAFTAYVYANASLPNDTVATYAYVNPVVAVTLGVLAGDQPVSTNLLLGGAIIVSSVLITVSGRRRSAPVPVKTPAGKPHLSRPATQAAETSQGAAHDD
jgi:drug/metabolite transporter (DMT)-like permease